MARRGKKKGRPVSGWVVLDKPVGMGSTEAVSKIKWLFQAEKAGHAGTLDPLASGMLPIALGEATKTVPYVQDGAKIYRFTVAWGQERSTDDLEGPVTRDSDRRPVEAEVQALLPKYTGVIMQTPPQFSAIKIAGERAYDLARDGETVDIPAREIEIGRLDIVEHGADHTVFEVECGKGTYVRSLARDMGRDLGCFGHISELRRIEVEPFTAEDFVTVAELEAARFGEQGHGTQQPSPDSIEAPIDFAAIDALLVDTSAALDCLPQIAISDDAATKIRLGNPVIIRGRDAPVEAEEACATARGKLVAIGAIEQGMFKPKRVFAG
ncbi:MULTISPECIES: tRNA pseudouridine(55) synthase TruB [unclassified Mesorhizobium]|uniref:tRNA pseudouridine(55) synthase TruB n=1 Tax=unclassified Mesorhizobium TaxID=325217 RepID=UPI00112B3CB2|nr:MULTISPECIES: tRNA pseudouridine(55) synthase TruB [unclassified Mesorhizobium]MBZ9701143.1 tRNA pseudouridine(55) synthase TruB [Mesorhizobium sp. CO1-1-3]MBZ9947795.1 tRNA pseudouridine(55) synthase TruB [Mesorhizobium sp. BR1-1-11]MBZ9952966.1 tRNA pseudouridine(55) synthase TruB [Mesorhizobium sp. BR1-1-15]TPI52903.1 tRNA pseudouridine(55) synthase TruB [Mesorhizobium sp. B3-1-1]TPJ00588.1 tRNA pseudouridine(55) synthase TruB [Mesorhizobium sp. B2-8-1]